MIETEEGAAGPAEQRHGPHITSKGHMRDGFAGFSAEAIPGDTPRDIVEIAVALAFQVTLPELRAPTRCRASVAFARQVAMYLMHVGCGLSLTRVGDLVGRDRTTVAHACGIIEDRRDDPDFDGILESLERAVAELMQAATTLRPSRIPSCQRVK